MQNPLRLIYPSRCLTCDALTETDFSLCGTCWGETPFIVGAACDCCGAQMLDADDRDEQLVCDGCRKSTRPWSRGRAALQYGGRARKIVLQLKYGDRPDLAKPAARWMAGVAKPIVKRDTIVVPVPLHWSRILRRKYNQSAELARHLGRELGLPDQADVLVRRKKTAKLDGKSETERHAELEGAISIHPRRVNTIQGRSVLLVDDVMTSGATLSACSEALMAAGAREVCVTTLARASKEH